MPRIGEQRTLSPEESADTAELEQEVLAEEQALKDSPTCECGAPKKVGEFWCWSCLQRQGDLMEEDLEANAALP